VIFGLRACCIERDLIENRTGPLSYQ